MKKQLALILVLALCLAGCGAEPPAPTEAPTTVPEVSTPATAPTEATAEAATEPTTEAATEPTYPATREAVLKNITLTMDFFDGGSYVIYIPRDRWDLETSSEGGNLTDCWSYSLAKGITVKVVNYGQTTPDAIEKRIIVTNSAYHFGAEEDGFYSGIDNVRGREMTFTTRSDGTVGYALVAEYPGGCGFSQEMRAIVDSFEIK